MSRLESIQYQTETVSQAQADVMALLPKQWKEVGHSKDKDAQINMKVYLEAEAKGAVFIHTAREYGRDLIGYSICFLQPHHQHDKVYGVNDAIYVVPEFRKTEVARRLLQYEKIEAASRGANCHTVSMKPHKLFGKMLEELGYKPLEITFIQEF